MKRLRLDARPGRLKGAELEALRRACFERDGWRCCVCGDRVEWEPGTWRSGHMAHIRGKRMWGDSLDNVRTLCMVHHGAEHNPKACPKKPK